jgi:hypothetical protein
MNLSPKDRAGRTAHSAVLPVQGPAPGVNPPSSGAARHGRVEPPPAPARDAPAAAPNPGGRGTPSRGAARGGTAGPGSSNPGPASSSPPALNGGAGGAREGGPGGVRAAAGSPPAIEPGGGARDRPAAPPPGTSGPEFLKRWQAILSGKARAAENERGRYQPRHSARGYRSGMARKLPPGGAR